MTILKLMEKKIVEIFLFKHKLYEKVEKCTGISFKIFVRNPVIIIIFITATYSECNIFQKNFQSTY